MVEILSKSEAQTKKIAGLLAQEIIKKPLKNKGALIIGLVGELGSGKTRFVQGFAKGLGIGRRLTSPTFVLMKKYGNLYHLDCYRLHGPKDLLALDFKEIISNPKNLVLIEWAEKVKKILPKDTIWIKFETINPRERKIKIL